MKYVGKLLATAAIATAMTVGAAQAQEKIHIIVVTHGQAASAFWSVAKKGVDDAAAEFPDLDVEYRSPDTFDMVLMAQLIDAAVASNPDGLVVSIPDADALGESIRSAVEAGIPVISMNSGSDVRKELGALLHVGQTEYEAGFGGGERMKADGVTKAACVNQEVGNVALDLRCQGFEDGLGVKVDVLATSLDPTTTTNAVVAYLTKNPDTQALFVLGQDAAIPALQGIEEVDKLGSVQVATFDLSEEILIAIDEGKMSFAIDQQQYLQGYLPVVLLRLLNRYQLLPGADVLTGPGFVTKANAAQVIELSAQGIR